MASGAAIPATARKTVMPSIASAKMTFRLVGGQDPKHIRKGLKKFVRDRLPKDCRVSLPRKAATAPA